MDNQGWIAINRAIISHWVWENARRFKWWIDLLLMASYKDQRVMYYGKLIDIRRGQLIASVSFLRERWAYIGDDEKRHTPTQATILKFLKLLEKENMIEINTKILPNRTTLITILNYSKYQDINSCIEAPPNNTENNTPNNTPNNEYNNINNINNISHTICAREESEISEKERWRQELLKDSVFIEQTAMSFRCTMDWLIKDLLPSFHAESIACEFNYNSYNDYRRGFFNYVRRENEKRLRTSNRTTRTNQTQYGNNDYRTSNAESQRQLRGQQYAEHIQRLLDTEPES